MSEKKFILVAGATGNQGGAVARALIHKGHSVRGLTRDTESIAAKSLSKEGVDMVKGDFTDSSSLEKACEGVDTVYAMMTPFEAGTSAETKQGIAMIDAAKKTNREHFILSSVASADENTGIPHFDSKFEVEKYLKKSGLHYTISAPVFFMENIFSPWYLPSLQHGLLTHALPEKRKLQQISLQDIGAFVTALVERGTSVYKERFDIAGDELTGLEEADILMRISGHKMNYKGTSPLELKEQSVASPILHDMAIMYEWFDKVGYDVNIKALNKDFSEVKWHSFEKWAKKQDWHVLDEVAKAAN